MELRRHVSFGKIYFALYFVALSIYFLVGLKPAEAANIESRILIPSIGLVSDVERLELENSELSTPDEIVGSFSRNKNKTLLIGHSSTVFTDLKNVKIGDEIVYRDLAYRVSEIELMEKSDISMMKVLSAEDKDTIILMTCAGELYDDGDASHRLLITALRTQ